MRCFFNQSNSKQNKKSHGILNVFEISFSNQNLNECNDNPLH